MYNLNTQTVNQRSCFIKEYAFISIKCHTRRGTPSGGHCSSVLDGLPSGGAAVPLESPAPTPVRGHPSPGGLAQAQPGPTAMGWRGRGGRLLQAPVRSGGSGPPQGGLSGPPPPCTNPTLTASSGAGVYPFPVFFFYHFRVCFWKSNWRVFSQILQHQNFFRFILFEFS